MGHHRSISPSPQRLDLIEFMKGKESCAYDRLTKGILHGIWPQDFPSNHQYQMLLGNRMPLGIWPRELAANFYRLSNSLRNCIGLLFKLRPYTKKKKKERTQMFKFIKDTNPRISTRS